MRSCCALANAHVESTLFSRRSAQTSSAIDRHQECVEAHVSLGPGGSASASLGACATGGQIRLTARTVALIAIIPIAAEYWLTLRVQHALRTSHRRAVPPASE